MSSAFRPGFRGWLAALAGLVAWGPGAAAGFQDHLGVQLYSLRNEGKTVASRLELAQSYGVTEVETAGTWGLPAAEFVQALREHQLTPISAHIGYDQMEKNVAAVIAEAKALGVEYVIVPSLP